MQGLPVPEKCIVTVLLNVFINDFDREIKCTFSKFVDDTRLGVEVDVPEIWDAIQRELDKLEEWVCVSLMRLSKSKCHIRVSITDWGLKGLKAVLPRRTWRC